MKLQDLLEAKDTEVRLHDVIDGHITRKFRTPVKGDLNCYGLGLTSLVGLPVEIGGGLFCHDNELQTLEGAPMKLGVISDNKSELSAWDNEITTLAGIGRKFIKEMYGEIWISGNPIKSNMLGIITIKDCHGIRIKEPPYRIPQKTISLLYDIFNKHLDVPRGHDKDVLECQEDLIQAGLKEYAKL